MEIVKLCPNLYAFHYKGEDDNELDRLMELWTDVEYLKNYATDNNIRDIDEFVEKIPLFAYGIDDLLQDIETNKWGYSVFFQALEDAKQELSLSRQKGKKNILRLYAIKIDNNCFVITGGAIKMSQKMEDHPDTKKELEKLQNAKRFLEDAGVLDDDSFFDFLELGF